MSTVTRIMLEAEAASAREAMRAAMAPVARTGPPASTRAELCFV